MKTMMERPFDVSVISDGKRSRTRYIDVHCDVGTLEAVWVDHEANFRWQFSQEPALHFAQWR